MSHFEQLLDYMLLCRSVPFRLIKRLQFCGQDKTFQKLENHLAMSVVNKIIDCFSILELSQPKPK